MALNFFPLIVPKHPEGWLLGGGYRFAYEGDPEGQNEHYLYTCHPFLRMHSMM